MNDKFHDEHAIETYKSLIIYGSAALKFVLISNGAAAIAIMTFIGNVSANGTEEVPDLRLPLGLLLVGVIVGGIAIGTAYFTQLRLFNESMNRANPANSHGLWLGFTLVLLALGLLLFAAGALSAVWKLS